MGPVTITTDTITFLIGLAINLLVIIRITNALEHRLTTMETIIKLIVDKKLKVADEKKDCDK